MRKLDDGACYRPSIHIRFTFALCFSVLELIFLKFMSRASSIAVDFGKFVGDVLAIPSSSYRQHLRSRSFRLAKVSATFREVW